MCEYLDFPPYFFFQLALKHCPKAAYTYKELWQVLNGKLHDLILKDEIVKLFGCSQTIFKNHLLLLRREGLVNFKINKKSYKIDLVPFDKAKDK